MTEHRRRIDTVLEPGYLADLSEADLDDLRRRRELAEDVETQISYYRRLLHGRLDLLNFELRRRNGQEERTLIEALPEILATGMTVGAEPNLRHIETMPPIPPTTGRRLIDKIMDDGILTQLPELTDEELAEAVDRLEEVEKELSVQRRQLHTVIDALQDEIIARYRSQQGEAQSAG
ncbi:MAG TPA: aerial mycelium formation protein [Acidimicrobiia bacterium]|nr:aerial mycelium formation protein [Acidimicrobiia bacterium]